MTKYKFILHEAVIYQGKIARIEDMAVDKDRKNIYLIQISATQEYFYAYEDELEQYIG